MSAPLLDPYSTARAIQQLAACLLLLAVALLVTAACQPSALALALAGIGLRAAFVLRRHAGASQATP
ncbi:hypothetical protein [Ectopseudomonas khazarica]|uniref:hypothetical protein n=1 Tax=Ectopseudomonas khazarica TaxID=2502979 RepID=UPI0037CB2BCB